MLNDKLKDYNIILASASPRRHAFLKSMNIDFEVRLHPVDEVYPNTLKGTEITDYLAKLKAEAFKTQLQGQRYFNYQRHYCLVRQQTC